MMPRLPNAAASVPTDVVVVGLGNIGSWAIDHLGRLPEALVVRLVDRGRYELDNRTGQQITPRDAGQPKSAVQARRLKAVNPAAWVTATLDDVANQALGALRARVVLACPDNLAARLAVNQAATRLGVPWVDAGVDPESGLARVTVYRPGPEEPCLECALNEADYRALGQTHLCGAPAPEAPPTHGSSLLGALAAVLAVAECAKVLRGQTSKALFSQQLIYSLPHHRQLVTRLRRNPHCRFDHRTFSVQPLRGITVRHAWGAALEACLRQGDSAAPATLAVVGRRFAGALVCPLCAAERPGLHLVGRLPAGEDRCARCAGEPMLPVAHLTRDHLDPQSLRVCARSALARAGVRLGDVLALETKRGQAFFEIV